MRESLAARIVADEAIPREPGSLKGTASFGETRDQAERVGKAC
jgi:hypothetical protein